MNADFLNIENNGNSSATTKTKSI